jgi:hypothetical protein
VHTSEGCSGSYIHVGLEADSERSKIMGTSFSSSRIMDKLDGKLLPSDVRSKQVTQIKEGILFEVTEVESAF